MTQSDQAAEADFSLVLDELASATDAGCSASELSAMLSRLAQSMAAAGMARAAMGCAQAADVLALNEAERTDEARRDFSALPMLLMDYLAMPDDEAVYAELLDYLFAPSQADPEPSHEAASKDPQGGDGPADPVVMQRVNADYLAMLADELGKLLSGLDKSLAVAGGNASGQTGAAMEQYAEEMALLENAAGTIDLTAFRRAVSLLGKCLSKAMADGIDAAQHAALAELPRRMLGYLHAPRERERAEAVVELLADGIWPAGLSAGERDRLAAELTAMELYTEAPEAEARPLEAQPDAVSLEIPEDINFELLEGLLQELPVQTSNFTSSIQSIAAGKGNREYLELAKRAAHTLKGAANTVGIRGIASLTHHLEDILIALSEHALLPGDALSETLVRAADCLEAMSDTLTADETPPGDALEVLQDVLNWANRIDREGVDAVSGGPLQEAQVEDERKEGGRRQNKPRPAPAAAGGLLRVPTQQMDEILRVVGETITTAAQAQNRLKSALHQIQALAQQTALFQQLAAELETMVDVRGVTASRQAEVEKEGFDALEFEQYGELHTLTRRLIEVAADSREMGIATEAQLADLGEILEDQARLLQQNQDGVMRTRMVPVKTVTSRLQRSVRQACRLLDKQAELSIAGEETLVDGNMLNGMIDPLMHLLRNAVDHGIESQERRTALGKPAVGRIELSFAREGDSIVLRCRDDGAGLDLAAIRASAQRKGLIDPGKPLDEEQIGRLVLLPGFSTRSESTQVSGRGIGMDAVYSHVLELKGALQLQSVAGRGLMVQMRLPNSLLSVHALLVRVHNQVVALSTRGIEDIHYSDFGRLESIGGVPAYRVGERYLKVMDLSALLGMQSGQGDDGGRGASMLMVRLDSGELRAIAVQEVLEIRHLVVKKLGRWVPRIGGVVGAAILGDGSVAPVLDLSELLRAPAEAAVRADSATADLGRHGTSAKTGSQPLALVVDDSLTARRSTAMALREAGFEVHTSIDGLDAVNALDRLTPDIVVTDMEMPRMNGLELSGHLRSRENTRHVPIIMITSRSTEKHRRLALNAGVSVYLTKPFENDELLGHVASLTGVSA